MFEEIGTRIESANTDMGEQAEQKQQMAGEALLQWHVVLAMVPDHPFRSGSNPNRPQIGGPGCQ